MTADARDPAAAVFEYYNKFPTEFIGYCRPGEPGKGEAHMNKRGRRNAGPRLFG